MKEKKYRNTVIMITLRTDNDRAETIIMNSFEIDNCLNEQLKRNTSGQISSGTQIINCLYK